MLILCWLIALLTVYIAVPFCSFLSFYLFLQQMLIKMPAKLWNAMVDKRHILCLYKAWEKILDQKN